MQKTAILFFFFAFTAIMLLAMSAMAQSNGDNSSGVSIGADSISIDSNGNVTIHGDAGPLGESHLAVPKKDRHRLDSLLGNVRANPFIQHFHPNGSDYYYPRDHDRYYMDIVPPSQKGKRIDHTKIWLLKEEVAASCP
ncbi:MAG TPA: hypothetical protein VGM92_11490 [Candidatus Kapabacteria bacterium]|jgi:hypothetical protein